MSLLKNLADLEENGKVGDWCFDAEEKNLWFRYPISDDEWAKWYGFPREQAPEMNRGDLVRIPIKLGVESNWQWDGNREAPTLSPSVNVVGRWHGYLRAGKLETV
jgi:hypothetical protein